MKKRTSRLIQRIAILSAGVLVLLYVVIPLSMGAFAAIRPARTCGDPPVGFAGVVLTAADGAMLDAWYTPGTNGMAIILLHGSGSNRDAVRPYADMLVRNGFGVLAMDLRGHGLSGGRANAFGWECTGDVAAAVDFLTGQPDVEVVGALGLSLGGEVLLGAAASCPEIVAIASEGASHRCEADYLSLTQNRSFARSWTTRALYWSVGVLTGSEQPECIADSIAGASGTAFLLIAAGKSRKEIDFNNLYGEIAGDRAEVWVVPGAEHTGALQVDRDEYERKTVAFFNLAITRHQAAR